MSSSKHGSATQGFYSRLKISANLFRLMMNLWPPFWGLRIHILWIAPDYRKLTVRMKLSSTNKNYVGTHFGGGLFSMCDPFYVVMLLNVIGNDYVVWDKAAAIQYVSPGRGTVFAKFHITDEQLAEIIEKTAHGDKFEPIYRVNVVDTAGKIVAIVDKTLYIRRKVKASGGKAPSVS